MIKRQTYLNDLDKIQHHVGLYGGGTQSTGMILNDLTTKRELDFAVFSDTGAEPQHVIDYKNYFTEYCKKEFDFDIYTVEKGNLHKDVLDYIDGLTNRVSSLPLRSENGLIMRQCTMDYKITPADKLIKSIIGIKRKNLPQDKTVALHMGISIDEIQRMKESRDWWKVLVYPLIELGFRREDTIKLVESHGLKTPPRSACWFCPFHSDNYWRHLQKYYPEEFKKAVEFDSKIREYPKLNKKQYLHRSCKPLAEAVKTNQKDLFGLNDECSGYCGM